MFVTRHRPPGDGPRLSSAYVLGVLLESLKVKPGPNVLTRMPC